MSGSKPGNRNWSLTAKLLASTGSSWARILVFFVVSFVLTPVLIGQLGLDLFGVFMLVSVSMALAGPLRGAIRKTITRELTTAVSSGDPDRVRATFSNGVWLGLIGGGLALAVTAGLALLAPRLLRVAPEHEGLLALAIAFEGLLIVELIVLMPWHNLYFATHRMVEENAQRAVNRALDLVAIGVAVVASEARVFVVFIATRFVLHTAQHVYKARRARGFVESARFDRALVDGRAVKEMAGVGGWSTANQIARLGFYQADQILLNLFFGPVYNGIYAIVNQLRSWARMFGGNVAFGVEAIAADLHEKGDRDGSVRVLLSVMKMTASITAFFAITAAVFAEPLVDLWLGDRLTKDAALLSLDGMTGEKALALIGAFVLIITPSTIIAETYTCASNVFYGMGLIRTYSIPMLVAAVLKIVLAAVMLSATGDPLWVAWTTLILQSALYIGCFGWIITKKCGVPVGRLLVEVYWRGIFSNVPVVIAGVLWVRMLDPLTVPTLLAGFVACGVLYSALFVTLCLSGAERRRLWSMGKMVRGRAMGRLRRAPGV